MPERARFLEHYRKADRIMLALIWLMFLFSLGLAFCCLLYTSPSPRDRG